MKKVFYKIECITNLHVGSGEVNYNIVDNQVERDAATGLPVIHASGVKGALRDAVKDTLGKKADDVFGAPGDLKTGKAGAYKFLDAHMVTRTMRVSGSNSMASIPVATVASINQLIRELNAFGCNTFGINEIAPLDFGNNKFLTNAAENILVEGEATGKLPAETVAELKKIEKVIGGVFAIVANFDDYDLPVVARNHLDNGISKNLWYEEVVPHGSVFTFVVMSPEDDNTLEIPEVVQFGGHASIGCGFAGVTKL